MNASEADPLPPEAPVAEPSGSGEEVAAKPKRKRTPRKTAVAGDPSAETSEATQSEPVRALGRMEPDTFVPSESAGPEAQGSGHAEAHESAGAEEPSSPEVGVSGSEDESSAPARRSRNRRRGRRGGERVRDVATPLPGQEPADAQAEGAELGAGPQAQAARPPAPLAVEVFAEVLSGAYDAQAPVAPEEPEAAGPAKRVLAPDADAPKLHKVLAQAGVGSRRDLEQMVVEGRVTVNGEVAHTGQRVSFGDRIQIDGKPVRYRIAPPPPRVIAYHKPVGEVVTHDDL